MFNTLIGYLIAAPAVPGYKGIKAMNREDLIEIIRRGPVRVTMNDASTHVIQSLEWCLVTPIYAHVLYRSEDGKLKSHFLSLVCMARVEELEPTEIG